MALTPKKGPYFGPLATTRAQPRSQTGHLPMWAAASIRRSIKIIPATTVTTVPMSFSIVDSEGRKVDLPKLLHDQHRDDCDAGVATDKLHGRPPKCRGTLLIPKRTVKLRDKKRRPGNHPGHRLRVELRPAPLTLGVVHHPLVEVPRTGTAPLHCGGELVACSGVERTLAGIAPVRRYICRSTHWIVIAP